MTTIRQQLHAAMDIAEDKASEFSRATREYNDARERVNLIIDKLAPLSDPNGVCEPQVLKAILERNKIALIKLVRVATKRYAAEVTNRNDAGCMGLKDAKELVEKWIEIGSGIE